MNKNLDELFDSYMNFYKLVVGEEPERWNEKYWVDKNDIEHVFLTSDRGFHLELTNKKGVYNDVCMQCWYTDECPTVVNNLDEILMEYTHH